MLLVGGTRIDGPFDTFGAAPPGVPFWYWGSGGTVELAFRDDHGADRFGWRIGMALKRFEP